MVSFCCLNFACYLQNVIFSVAARCSGKTNASTIQNQCFRCRATFVYLILACVCTQQQAKRKRNVKCLNCLSLFILWKVLIVHWRLFIGYFTSHSSCWNFSAYSFWVDYNNVSFILHRYKRLLIFRLALIYMYYSLIHQHKWIQILSIALNSYNGLCHPFVRHYFSLWKLI